MKKRGRGRPKGSKNKVKSEKAVKPAEEIVGEAVVEKVEEKEGKKE